MSVAEYFSPYIVVGASTLDYNFCNFSGSGYLPIFPGIWDCSRHLSHHSPYIIYAHALRSMPKSRMPAFAAMNDKFSCFDGWIHLLLSVYRPVHSADHDLPARICRRVFRIRRKEVIAEFWPAQGWWEWWALMMILQIYPIYSLFLVPFTCGVGTHGVACNAMQWLIWFFYTNIVLFHKVSYSWCVCWCSCVLCSPWPLLLTGTSQMTERNDAGGSASHMESSPTAHIQILVYRGQYPSNKDRVQTRL